MHSIRSRALSLQQRIQEQELDWLRSDISLLSAQVNRRHAFLTTVRDRARADADLCDQVQRRAALLRTSLEEQVPRTRETHTCASVALHQHPSHTTLYSARASGQHTLGSSRRRSKCGRWRRRGSG
eukprot:Tamp_30081.p1 GENE.Tamp_30081~~Tamp_30081.p1  ORF type:complete len:137 (+),score=15.76 Tamp_30081:35-412(+)